MCNCLSGVVLLIQKFLASRVGVVLCMIKLLYYYCVFVFYRYGISWMWFLMLQWWIDFSKWLFVVV